MEHVSLLSFRIVKCPQNERGIAQYQTPTAQVPINYFQLWKRSRRAVSLEIPGAQEPSGSLQKQNPCKTPVTVPAPQVSQMVIGLPNRHGVLFLTFV